MTIPKVLDLTRAEELLTPKRSRVIATTLLAQEAVDVRDREMLLEHLGLDDDDIL